jgi:hypothetical protein
VGVGFAGAGHSVGVGVGVGGEARDEQRTARPEREHGPILLRMATV